MKQSILFVLTQSDVESLPAAAQVLRAEQYDAVWLLISPATFVDTKVAEDEHSRNLADLEAAIERCAKSRDWGGASAYQAKLDAAKLQKAIQIKDAWKTLDAAQRQVAEQRIVAAFGDPCGQNQRFQPLADHYEPSQFIDALNSVRKNWHAPCVPPDFSLHFAATLARSAVKGATSGPHLLPEQTVTLAQIQQPPAGAPTNTPAPAPEPEKKGYTHLPRFKELTKMTIEQLGDIAIKLKLTPKGTRLGIAHQVMKAELAKVPVAA